MLARTSHAPLAPFRDRAPEGEDQLIAERTAVQWAMTSIYNPAVEYGVGHGLLYSTPAPAMPAAA